MVRYPDYIKVFRPANADGDTTFQQEGSKYDPFSDDSVKLVKIYEGDCKVIAKERTGIYDRSDFKVMIPDPDVPNIQERDVCQLTMNGGIDGDDSNTKTTIETIVNSYIHYEYNSIVNLIYRKDGNEDE